MADINVERKGRSPLPWILGLILLAALAFLIWKYLAGGGDNPAPAATNPDSAAAAQ